MEWDNRSKRLWVAEHNGRRFRIERTGDAARGTGPVILKEVDRLQREIRRDFAKNFAAATKLCDEWIEADAA